MNLPNTNQITFLELLVLAEPGTQAGSPNSEDVDAAKGMIFGIILGVVFWGLIVGVLSIFLH